MADHDKNIQSLTARINELETKVTFQQDAIDNLNDVITSQWKIIDQLKSQVTKLDDQLYELEMSTAGAPSNQKPPHY
jgi:SlyX protein